MKPKATDTPGGFIFRCDWAAALLEMPPELRLKINDAIFRYVLNGEEPTDPAVKFSMFPLIRAELDRNAEKYANVCEKRREAGRRGGKKGNKAAADPEASDGSPMDETETATATPQRKATAPTKQLQTLGNIREYIAVNALNVDAEEFYDYYASQGWEIDGKPIRNVAALLKRWSERANGTIPTKSPARYVPNARGEVNVNGVFVKLGRDEYVDNYGQRCYGNSSVIVPLDAPPRPGSGYDWSDPCKRWVYNTV